jgi:hypothetical protein
MHLVFTKGGRCHASAIKAAPHAKRPRSSSGAEDDDEGDAPAARSDSLSSVSSDDALLSDDDADASDDDSSSSATERAAKYDNAQSRAIDHASRMRRLRVPTALDAFASMLSSAGHGSFGAKRPRSESIMR